MGEVNKVSQRTAKHDMQAAADLGLMGGDPSALQQRFYQQNPKLYGSPQERMALDILSTFAEARNADGSDNDNWSPLDYAQEYLGQLVPVANIPHPHPDVTELEHAARMWGRLGRSWKAFTEQFDVSVIDDGGSGRFSSGQAAGIYKAFMDGRAHPYDVADIAKDEGVLDTLENMFMGVTKERKSQKSRKSRK